MKIGILTFWWTNDNYGQILQCFALQKFLNDLGHDAFLIKYNYTDDVLANSFIRKCIGALNPIKVIKFLIEKKNNKIIEKEVKENNRHFEDFKNTYIKQTKTIYTKYKELLQNPPEADMYIVGSDQVWNYSSYSLKRFQNPLHAYFLDFGKPETKRISYAASWGKTSITEEYKKEIRPLLQKFDYVSVREESGIPICNECGKDNIDYVCDPTFLLDKEKYRSLYSENNIRKPERPFILLYILANKYTFNLDSVYDFAEKKKLEVIYITGNGVVDKRKKNYATLPEWLWLVDNADYVISNSFHCAVFSIIFHKKFGIIPLSGIQKEMNSRFDSLFKSCGTGCRYIDNNDYSVLEEKYDTNLLTVSDRFLRIIM